MLVLPVFITSASKSPRSSKFRIQKARSLLYQKLSRRCAQKGYTSYAKHKGSLCPRDNGKKQKNWLHRGLLYCDANHHVRKKIACLSRWRVRMDKWTNNMNVWSAQNSFHIHSWLRITIIISSSNIVHSFIIHHTCWTPLQTTTTATNNNNQQRPTTTTDNNNDSIIHNRL